MAVRWQEVKVGQPSEPYYLKPLKYIAWIFCSMNIIMKHFDVSLLSGNWIQMESFDHLVEYSDWSKVIHAWSLISSVGEAYFYKIQAILFLNISVGPTILRWFVLFLYKIIYNRSFRPVFCRLSLAYPQKLSMLNFYWGF